MTTPIRSAFYNGGAPTGCCFCNQPFPVRGNHLAAWHGSDDRYYCEQSCEQDALEAAGNARKRAS